MQVPGASWKWALLIYREMQAPFHSDTNIKVQGEPRGNSAWTTPALASRLPRPCSRRGTVIRSDTLEFLCGSAGQWPSVVPAVAWISAVAWVWALAQELPRVTGKPKKPKKQKTKKRGDTHLPPKRHLCLSSSPGPGMFIDQPSQIPASCDTCHHSDAENFLPHIT